MKNLKTDIEGLIIKMQQQLVSLERKIDTLVGSPRGHGEIRRDRDYRDRDRGERAMYKAICADCNKECEVPFRPRQDRPVYCKECFSSRKVGDSFKESRDNRPREKDVVREHPFAKYQRGKNRRRIGKRKSASKKHKK